MKVKDLLATKGREVVSIDVGKSVEDAIRTMNRKKISAIVITKNDKPVGIFTERDVVRCYLATGGRAFRDIEVREAMTSSLIVAEMGDDLNKVMSVMIEKNIRHIPVMEGGNMKGILSIRDVIQSQVGKLP